MNVYDVLKQFNIPYIEISHKAVFTIEEAILENIPNRIEGTECKNLFVKGKDHYYLIFIEASKRANFKALAKLVGEKKLSLASPLELNNILGLTAGSVSPFGILNDSNYLTTLLIDKQLCGRKVLVHPNINTKTLSLQLDDILTVIQNFNHEYLFI